MSDEFRDRVLPVLSEAKSYCWDGCHKIYILLDSESVSAQEGYGYELTPVTDINSAADELYDIWNCSCGLRFVNAIRNGGHSNDDYEQVIEQFAELS